MGGIFTVKIISVNLPPLFYRKYAPLIKTAKHCQRQGISHLMYSELAHLMRMYHSNFTMLDKQRVIYRGETCLSQLCHIYFSTDGNFLQLLLFSNYPNFLLQMRVHWDFQNAKAEQVLSKASPLTTLSRRTMKQADQTEGGPIISIESRWNTNYN